MRNEFSNRMPRVDWRTASVGTASPHSWSVLRSVVSGVVRFGVHDAAKLHNGFPKAQYQLSGCNHSLHC